MPRSSNDELDRMIAEKWLTGGTPVPTIAMATMTQGGALDEVQRVGFTSGIALMGGTFTLTFGGQTTGTIAYIPRTVPGETFGFHGDVKWGRE